MFDEHSTIDNFFVNAFRTVRENPGTSLLITGTVILAALYVTYGSPNLREWIIEGLRNNQAPQSISIQGPSAETTILASTNYFKIAPRLGEDYYPPPP